LIKAEGTGLEPATPYGAPHFQSSPTCSESLDITHLSTYCQQIASSQPEIDPDLQIVVEAWATLPNQVQAQIIALVAVAQLQDLPEDIETVEATPSGALDTHD